ncbi:Protoheme IX farnesyltransferase, mitochondrial [Portunus trituberculatus]|uniref:Protoheme IX farnesyltransferase, mitochondrial n=1 Tax=Portunus trituberculatus TaxID=210409 RepID=A0A5B7CWB9_PORTR|nr:Protoheme IX farnesyltransferase, mitochondrial [Portunus trituberculatus]
MDRIRTRMLGDPSDPKARIVPLYHCDLCRRVTLRYSLAMVGICTLAPVIDVTTWTFAADSLPFNGYLVYLAWKFYQDADSKSSRKLFFFSLIHLPVILTLMIISKKHYGRNKKAEVTVAKKSEVNYITSEIPENTQITLTAAAASVAVLLAHPIFSICLKGYGALYSIRIKEVAAAAAVVVMVEPADKEQMENDQNY